MGLPFKVVATALFLSLALQTAAHKHQITCDSCKVIVPKDYHRFRKAAARRARLSPTATGSVIKNTGRVFVFRLATCILPEYVQQGFGNVYQPKSREEVVAEVRRWWDQLESDLNG